MSLSERLAAAAAARGQRMPDTLVRRSAPPESTAPVPPAAPLRERLLPEPGRPEPTAEAGHKRIIAPASSVVDAIDPDPEAEPDSICPTCGRRGEVGMVDLPGRTVDWACTACRTLWQVVVTPAGSPADGRF